MKHTVEKLAQQSCISCAVALPRNSLELPAMIDVLPGSNLKLMSAADQRMIDEAIELVNRMTLTSLQKSAKPSEEKSSSSRSKLKALFRLSSHKKSQGEEKEKKSFTEQFETRTAEPLVSPEAEEAYNILVAKKPPNHTQSNLKFCSSTHSESRRHRTLRSQSVNECVRTPPSEPVYQNIVDSLSMSSIDEEISDIPSVPPPPVPNSSFSHRHPFIDPRTIRRTVSCQPQRHSTTEAIYQNTAAFTCDDAQSNCSSTDSFPVMSGRYKSASDNVSYEDLLEFSEERRAVKYIKQIMGSQVSDESCLVALNKTNQQPQNAVKYLKLKQLYELSLGSMEQCQKALVQNKWDVKLAVDALLRELNL